MSTVMQSKLTARIHRMERIRVPFLPPAASKRNNGVERTTRPLNDRHFATHDQPKRSTSQGIVKKAITQTTNRPETETSEIQSTARFHRASPRTSDDARNFLHTKKARIGGEKKDNTPRILNIEVNADGVGGHIASFSERSTVGD